MCKGEFFHSKAPNKDIGVVMLEGEDKRKKKKKIGKKKQGKSKEIPLRTGSSSVGCGDYVEMLRVTFAVTIVDITIVRRGRKKNR